MAEGPPHAQRAVLLLALFLSLLGHGFLALILSRIEVAKQDERRSKIALKVVEKEPPKRKAQEPAPIEIPYQQPPPPSQPTPISPRPRQIRKQQLPGPPKPPQPQKALEQGPPAPKPSSELPSFGIRLENIAPGPGLKVPVGETLKTAPREVREDPKLPRLQGSEGAGIKTEPISTVDEMPKVIADSVAEYPEEARRLGIQGKVVLELLVDENGNVASARVLRSLHKELDQAALKAAKGLRFTPARRGGKAVSVRIPYTYVFVLE